MGVGWDPFFVMWCVLIKDGRLGHCVCDVLWKGGFRVNGGTARRIVFWIKGVPLSLSLDGTCCKNAKSSCRNTEVLLNSVVQTIWFSSAFAIDVSGCAHSRHGVPAWTMTTSHLMRFCCFVCEKRYPLDLYLGPTIPPLGLTGHIGWLWPSGKNS